MENISSFYKILGLKSGAPISDVKQAYRDLIRVWHPDRFAHDPRLQKKAEERLKEINEAYRRIIEYDSSVKDKGQKHKTKDKERKYKSRAEEEDQPIKVRCPFCGKMDGYRTILVDPLRLRPDRMGNWCPHCKREIPDEPIKVEPEKVVPVVRPWIRFWARNFDYIVAWFIVPLIGYITIPRIMPKLDKIFFPFLIVFIWTFLESHLLNYWGYTPGKKLLGISVRDRNGNRLSYEKALNRSFKVYWRGMGIGFPIISFVTMFISYNKLIDNGITSWDKENDIIVTHQKIDF
jgi:uncharacterized RDD family membrane protein YckC